MEWRNDVDRFSFHLEKQESTNASTKLDVLRKVAQNFDPLGLLAPAKLEAKLFLQRLWVEGYGWHSRSPSKIQQKRRKVKDVWDVKSSTEISRFIVIDARASMELHVFVGTPSDTCVRGTR